VSVVTETQIKDQGFQSISDVTRYVPGVQIHQGEGNRDQISIRGQVASTADFFVNGVRDDAQIFRDLYNTSRVEVLKGASALIFGRGGAGGVVNRVTKQADFETVHEISAEAGSFNHKRIVGDVGQALNPFAAFRVTAMKEESGSYRDQVSLGRWAVNPTFAFKPADRTTVVVGYEHAEDKRTSDRGIPSYRPPGSIYAIPTPADRSTYFGNPSAGFSDAKTDSLFATVEHKTEFGVSLRNHTSWATYDKMYQNIYAGGPLDLATDLVPIVAYNNINNRENLFNQTDLTYKFQAGPTRHTLLAGMELGHQQSNNFRRNGTFDAGTGDCVSFGVGNSLPRGTCFVRLTSPTIASPNLSFVTPATRNKIDLDVRSLYVQDQIEITRYLEVIGGVRQESFALKYANGLTPSAAAPAALSRSDNLVSPRAGVILKPTETLSVYASYGVSYLPASGDQFSSVATATVNLEPEKYINREVGVKWDITKRLALTAATYKTDRENVRFANADGTFIQTGQSRVKGAELTLTGTVTDDWQLSAGYTRNFGELAGATSPTLVAGTPLPNLPRETISIWNRYQFLPNWGVGAGVVYHAPMFAALQPRTNLVQLPAFTSVDAALYWKMMPNISAQLNVTNVFNTRYIQSADSNDNILPGAPTTATLSITSKF
jgi:catecholate siderophore receptor